MILVVDKVLETQDLNGDGLMTPAELINFPGEAPRHTELREPLEPPDVGTQFLSAKSPSRQEAQEALDPREEAAGQTEARMGSLEPVPEAGGQAEAGGEAPHPGGQARGQVEAGGEAPSPGGEAGGQAEARDTGEETEELPGETVDPKNTPNEFEIHAIQLENDEI